MSTNQKTEHRKPSYHIHNLLLNRCRATFDCGVKLISIIHPHLFQSGMGPDSMGQAYQAYGGEQSNFTYMDRMQQQKNVEEAEDLDINASLHGNWTMENAKSKLHQFLQLNKIQAEYIYKAVGPDHTKLVYFQFWALRPVF